MNLIYLYTSSGVSKNPLLSWDTSAVTKNKFARQIHTDGMIQMFDLIAARGYLNSVSVFIDSAKDHGKIRLSPRTNVYVVPDMDCVQKFLNPGDIIVVRGGFKSWMPFLRNLHGCRKHWILFYAANTNRTKWSFWDVVLDDLIDEPIFIHHPPGMSRYYFNFSKPIHEGIFKPIPQTEKVYDVMAGASHIHKKKGQYQVLLATIEYEKQTGKRLKIVLPGGTLRCFTNKLLIQMINTKVVDVDFTRAVTRIELCKLMSQSKIFAHAGGGGQNDRGVLEALRCGLPTIIANPKRFSPFLSSNDSVVKVLKSPPTEDVLLKALYERSQIKYKSVRTRSKELCSAIIEMLKESGEVNVADWYSKQNGMNEVCIPKMLDLIKRIKDNPNPRGNNEGMWR